MMRDGARERDGSREGDVIRWALLTRLAIWVVGLVADLLISDYDLSTSYAPPTTTTATAATATATIVDGSDIGGLIDTVVFRYGVHVQHNWSMVRIAH
jgi:hypothetical protein